MATDNRLKPFQAL